MATITISVNGKPKTSRPFDMHCYRAMYDYMIIGERENGIIKGYESLFPDVPLHETDSHGIASALMEIGRLFDNVIDTLAAMPRKRMVGENNGHPIRQLYKSMLQYHLPSEIDRQEPVFFYQVMCEQDSEAVTEDSIPESMRKFCGL